MTAVTVLFLLALIPSAAVGALVDAKDVGIIGYTSQRALRAGIAEFDNGQIWTGKWLSSETGKVTVCQYKPDCFKEPPKVVGFWCGRLHCSESTNNVTTVYKIRQLSCNQLMIDNEGRKGVAEAGLISWYGKNTSDIVEKWHKMPTEYVIREFVCDAQ